VILLKLGGSLITQKDHPNQARADAIERIAGEIAETVRREPGLPLLIGHGSGSFGHSAAAKHQTREGVRTRSQWLGFVEVWSAALTLHRTVIDALRETGLPAISLPPSASAICADGELVELAVEPVQRALAAGLLPVVYGDVSFDRTRGGTIVSTEQVLAYLANSLPADRLLLAGSEPGVFADYPDRRHMLEKLTRQDLAGISLRGAEATDVTGGMADKVRRSLELVEHMPSLEIRIFSGQQPGSIQRALLGGRPGTLIAAT
jgi:isopentenyl phosphate kinase